MRVPSSPTAAPPGRAVACACLAVILLWGSARAGEDETLARLRGDARSAFAGRRAATVERLVAQGAASREPMRAWTRERDALLRLAAWDVLAATGEAIDLVGALVAVADPDPEVAFAAARAALALAERLPSAGEPWLARDTLAPGGAAPLAFALAKRLDAAFAGRLPPCLLRLGEGAVPALVRVAARAAGNAHVRRGALEALGRIGGDAARAGLVSFATREDVVGDGAWWDALAAVGPGPQLAPAYACASELAASAGAYTGGFRARRRLWRVQASLLDFLAACPPPPGAAPLLRMLEGLVLRAASPRARVHPALATRIVRAHLVLAEPTDEALTLLVRAARPSSGAGRQRVEELGAVLELLAPFRARPCVRDAARDLLDEDDLPASVRAWALLLAGDTRPAALMAEAQALVRGDGGAATVARRRLGARLLERAGAPPRDLVETLLEDLDPVLRATALRWATRAVADGRFPSGRLGLARDAALDDPDDGVLLAAAATWAEGPPAALHRRLLRVAVDGPREHRVRAWRLLAAAARAASAGTEPDFRAPPGSAGLDARLRAAGRVAGLLGL